MLTEFYDEDNIARIGFVGDLELYINTDDVCPLPHFHICDRGTKGIIFYTTICLDDAVYFNHSGKADRLDTEQKKRIINFLQSKKEPLDITNWQYVLILWNTNNDYLKIDLDFPMPDYTKLRCRNRGDL